LPGNFKQTLKNIRLVQREITTSGEAFYIVSRGISKIEKWFEVKPPARGAYAPEGTARKRNRRNIYKYFEDYDSSRTKRSGHLAFLR